MKTDLPFPDLPQVVHVNGRCYLPVAWEEADVLHEVLRRSGHPTTLCLNPETREARLELWPGVNPDAVLTALECRRTPPHGAAPSPAATDRKWAAVAGPDAAAADLICI
jgi:hypothetical protein